MARKATIGSISHGTLRSEDLISAFADELEHLEGNVTSLVEEANAATALLSFNWALDDDQMSELVQSLQEALEAHAPAYCYFGTHVGDGSDFGFWPDMESIEELPRIADPNELPTGEDCAFVNDHGNVTVYAADGKPVIELV
jgi:hypothetical protein